MSEFKIHHTVSELCSFFGISPAGAEKYTESLKVSMHQDDNTQASASSAVKLLAEKSDDPVAFMNKYDELKSRNLQDVDSLVVFLSGLQEDQNIKRIVEDISRQKLDEETDVPVPEIISEIQQSTKTTLTGPELDRLRDRLLREAELIRSPNEVTYPGIEDRTTHMGPPTPDWVNNRPYSSADFVIEEQRPETAPLGEVPCSSQERLLIEDLLSRMIGNEGIYITVEPASNSYDPPKFTVDPSVDATLGQSVCRILPICGYYSQLARFIEDKNQYHSGLVNQALAAAIRDLIKDYLLLIVQLEEKHRQLNLTLHKLFFYIEITMGMMDMLACITSVISRSGAHGGAVLSLLHDRTLSLTGCGNLQDVMVCLTKAAAIPYMKMLSTWLYLGIINDPYNEFMVVDREAGKDEVNNNNADDYWEKRYYSVPQNIPTFLKAHGNNIVRTGKYLNVIRQSGQVVSCPDQQKLSYGVHDSSYTEVIERTYNFASKRLLELLMKEKDLMGRLRSVKRCFLLDQGDFVAQLMGLCDDELQKNIDDVLPNRLASLVELAVTTSTANNDIYKDDIVCELQPVILMTQMLRILSIETEAEQDYYLQDERLQLSGFQGFSLGYRVTWPVSLVLDLKSITCYQMIFRHLFFCKHVESLLCRVWVSNKVTKSFPLSASRTYSSAFALRQRMLNFIQNIEYYMFEVIEQNWQTFINKMEKVENVDEVLVSHNDFLGSCLKDTMLTSPELLRIISKLTGICVNFANFIEESPEPASSTHEDSESFEQTISKFELQFSGMIYTLMDKICEQGRENYNDALINVIKRLDFNMYYSKKHEHLGMASSPEVSME